MSPRRYVEHGIQAEIVTWADLVLGPTARLLVHVPNGRHAGGARQGGLWKALGVRSGVPDLLLLVPRGGACGLALELKAPKGRPSPAQVEYQQALSQAGWEVRTATSAAEGVEAIAAYLGVPSGLEGRL